MFYEPNLPPFLTQFDFVKLSQILGQKQEYKIIVILFFRGYSIVKKKKNY